jgi:allantoinase
VLVDLAASDELSPGDLYYRHRHSPFLGRTLCARVVRTPVRGRTVFADGQIVGQPAGRLLIPTTTQMESR